MPYYFDDVDEPNSDTDWDQIEKIWQIIKNDLMDVHFETCEEALSQKYRKSLDPRDMRTDSWAVARYRETDDRENLKEFHQWGLEALSYTEHFIKNRQFGAKFTFHWTKLTACHGFVCAALMARGDDMQSKRAGEAGGSTNNRHAQRKWYLHWRRYHQEELGWTVNRCNRDFIEVCWQISYGNQSPPDGFSKEWFNKALGEVEDEDGDKVKKPVRTLSNSLKRSGYGTPKADDLLLSLPDEDPTIPPFSSESYK